MSTARTRLIDMHALTIKRLQQAAVDFAARPDLLSIPTLFGVTDGKAVGTYLEHDFRDFLSQEHTFEAGSSASGIDFPSLCVDLKVTSAKQPQSSCPYESADQKLYGLGYHLLIFVYEKVDDRKQKVASLSFQHVIFVEDSRTADYQTTRGVLEILERDANLDDLMAFMEERNLPLDDVGRKDLAMRILKEPPVQGYLTISNALQWRLQYGRAIDRSVDGSVPEIKRLTR